MASYSNQYKCKRNPNSVISVTATHLSSYTCPTTHVQHIGK